MDGIYVDGVKATFRPEDILTGDVVEDGAITPVKLNKESFEPVNVLAFGVKNDGSEDCSAIINEYTEDYPLYFPSGTYKISSPVVLKNSIYGAGYSRRNSVDSAFTWFVSEINNQDGSTGVFEVSDSKTITIENLNISLNSKECGILIKDTTNYIYINKVNITKVSKYGIFATDTVAASFASRLLYVDNVSIFGRSNYPASTGLRFQWNTGDCRVSNAEIMGTQIGLWLAQGIFMVSSVHIWTGCLMGEDADNWWSSTVGVRLDNTARMTADNLYLDTCHVGIFGNSDACYASIKNIITAEDATIANSSSYSGSLIYLSNGNGRIDIDGGILNFRDSPHIRKVLSSPSYFNTFIRNVTIRTDAELTASNYAMFMLNSCGQPTQYTIPIQRETNTNKYVEVARINLSYSSIYGSADIRIRSANGYYCDLKIIKTPDYSFIATSNDRLYSLYYKTLSDGLLALYLYIPGGSTNTTAFTVYLDGATNGVDFFDFGKIYTKTVNAQGTYEVARESTTSSTGLTKVPLLS